MKNKLLIMIWLLVSILSYRVLANDICWNINKSEWMEYSWVQYPTVDYNSIDIEGRYMFTYQTNKDSYSCQYIEE